ncbi:MAG: hypothetical protein ACYC26_04015 [Phycisphaerales bacterium]
MTIYDDHLVETLTLQPSWTNRAGRPDRSACLVLRTADVNHCYPGITLTEHELRKLLSWQLPLQTSGDHRTRKSNAIKRRYHRGLYLPPNWSQTIKIERHRLHARLMQHFLVCPGCGSASSNQKSAISNPKFLKLFLPLCTAAEWRDANMVRMVLSHAAPWSLGLPSKSLHPVMPPEWVTKLIHRYQPLLWRGFACRRCLGLRYGEVKPPEASRRVERDILAPAWAKEKPAYYESLTIRQRADVNELFNKFRLARERREAMMQPVKRMEKMLATLENKYPGVKFRQ